MPSMEKTMQVACVVMADGQVEFVPNDKKAINTAVKKWRDSLSEELMGEHVECNTGGGVVIMTVLARDFFVMAKSRKGFTNGG